MGRQRSEQVVVPGTTIRLDVDSLNPGTEEDLVNLLAAQPDLTVRQAERRLLGLTETSADEATVPVADQLAFSFLK